MAGGVFKYLLTCIMSLWMDAYVFIVLNPPPPYNTYYSKDLFVTEYRVMLADKLLNSFDFSADKERQTLELLKVGIHDVGRRSFWEFCFYLHGARATTRRCPTCQLCVCDKSCIVIIAHLSIVWLGSLWRR